MAFTFSEAKVSLLDGGFGTTLEDVFGKDISGALWSASLVDKEPETIVNAHLAFLNSGCDVVLTATYQCAFETFDRAGYSKSDAVRLMRKAVLLAAQAKEKYQATRNTFRKVHVVLSLGPFGATQSPAQEFDGIYPPPYGPQAYQTVGTNTNAFTDPSAEEAAVEALADFHYERARVFVESEEESDNVWSQIDGVAFETVPLAREVTAIRRAAGRLKMDLEARGQEMKPWWISTVWPSGVHPQQATPGGGRLTVEQVVRALLSPAPFGRPVLGDSGGLPSPDGIGINCTHIADLDPILPKLRAAVEDIKPPNKPFLALYPNGGGVYDIVNHVWLDSRKDDDDSEEARSAWADQLASIARTEQATGVWKGLIVGGCCKTRPTHIDLLGEVLGNT